MNRQNDMTSFAVARSPQEGFDAINNPRGRWSRAIEGDTHKLGAVFYCHYRDVHRCAIKITELVPGKKVVGMCCTTSSTS